MKKVGYFFSVCVFLFLFGTNVVLAQGNIVVKNQFIEGEQIEGENVFLPVRQAAEALHYDLDWKAPKVIVTGENFSSEFSVGEKEAIKKGEKTTLLTAPYLSFDSTMIEIKDLPQVFNCTVRFENGTYYVNPVLETLDSYMEELNVLAYCEGDGVIYYVTLGDLEGFHKMNPDGSEDKIIGTLEGINVNGSTQVTASYENGQAFFHFKQLSQLGEEGKLEQELSAETYSINEENGEISKVQ